MGVSVSYKKKNILRKNFFLFETSIKLANTITQNNNEQFPRESSEICIRKGRKYVPRCFRVFLGFFFFEGVNLFSS